MTLRDTRSKLRRGFERSGVEVWTVARRNPEKPEMLVERKKPDGAPGGGSSLDLASAMAAAKITTSVVGLGSEQDKDVAFLRQLAERGQGRFYLTADATTLPQIFSTETVKVAQFSVVEEPTLAVPVAKSLLTAGMDWAQSPLPLGYNVTKPKPTADVLLATERGELLLTTWRYGLGQTAAFTSDAKARWAADAKEEEIFAHAAHPAQRRRELTNWFIIAALALLPVDIFLRRWIWR